MTFEVYFVTALTLDDFALFFRGLLNLAPTNASSHQVAQRRDSFNRGGLYFLFEVLGLELALMSNAGEVAIPERGEASVYVLVEGGDEALRRLVAQQIARLANRAGVAATVDSLSA
jgi:hypothetical protein